MSMGGFFQLQGHGPSMAVVGCAFGVAPSFSVFFGDGTGSLFDASSSVSMVDKEVT